MDKIPSPKQPKIRLFIPIGHAWQQSGYCTPYSLLVEVRNRETGNFSLFCLPVWKDLNPVNGLHSPFCGDKVNYTPYPTPVRTLLKNYPFHRPISRERLPAEWRKAIEFMADAV